MVPHSRTPHAANSDIQVCQAKPDHLSDDFACPCTCCSLCITDCACILWDGGDVIFEQ